MASLSKDIDVDITPIPRSREENQERAFVAASRRKDRSLDARLESANRASMLHKKRTGKALNITKEIVEKEAMYEEVDERYQEKRLRMLQAQNMQIEEQFQRQLLAAFAAGANSTRQQRPAPPPHRASTGGVTKMRLDLPTARASFSEGSRTGSLANSILTSPGCISTPGMTYSESPKTPYVQTPGSSYMQTPGAYSQGLPSPRVQIPQYVAQPSPTWQPQMQHPQQSYQGAPQISMQSVEAWRWRILQQAQLSGQAASQGQAYRARLASAPELPQQPLSPVTTAEEAAKGTRAQSEPSLLASQETGVPSEFLPSIPEQDIFTETWQTPELCPSPSTSNKSPASPCTKADNTPAEPDSGVKQGFMVSTNDFDPDFDEFTHFAFGLGNNSTFQDPLDTSAFDDWVSFDLDFATVA
ncbi:hypothetical protein VTN00DRAFT_1514 [Thermoascus crustaceus]|uniref:uncharacterized protein n=1 Tax=Thermoascus crustaceus TaxID=5088 RepID=UPI003743B562